MASPGEDLERRVSALEANVSRIQVDLERAKGDAAAARILAGGADHDVGEMREELRAHTRVLNALRETQIEHEFEMRRGFAEVDRKLAIVNIGVSKILELMEQQPE